MVRNHLHVAALERVDEALDQLADTPVTERADGGLLALLREPPVDVGASALRRAVDRGDGRVHRVRHLLDREAEHLAAGSIWKTPNPSCGIVWPSFSWIVGTVMGACCHERR
jgi:hypothetical protein